MKTNMSRTSEERRLGMSGGEKRGGTPQFFFWGGTNPPSSPPPPPPTKKIPLPNPSPHKRKNRYLEIHDFSYFISDQISGRVAICRPAEIAAKTLPRNPFPDESKIWQRFIRKSRI